MRGGVRIIGWPRERDAFEEAARAGTPRLAVVDAGAEPPLGSDCCQDWMWRTGSGHEMRLRLRQLALRALSHGHGRPHLDSLGTLHIGLRSVHLPPKELALAAVLIANFNAVVPSDELIAAAWPNGIGRPNVLAMRISSLRSRLDWVGLGVRGSTSKGYSMCAETSMDPAGAVQGFEDDLDAARWLEARIRSSGEP